MKTYFLLSVFLLICTVLQAQRLDFDIFGNLTYRAQHNSYEATFKKDIFDNMVFADSRKNEVNFKKKYLDLFYPGLAANKEAQIDFFRHFIHTLMNQSGYVATYEVDIFDRVQVTDNRSGSVEISRDIFGNYIYRENNNGLQFTVTRGIRGELNYKSGSENAVLEKNISGKWRYRDSSGNDMEFSEQTWERLMHAHGDDEAVLFFLLNAFLFI
jgi:lipid II isoglutaminyl synthase (glutamine-hydrolysing)